MHVISIPDPPTGLESRDMQTAKWDRSSSIRELSPFDPLSSGPGCYPECGPNQWTPLLVTKHPIVPKLPIGRNVNSQHRS
jgi:hypothetical protein